MNKFFVPLSLYKIGTKYKKTKKLQQRKACENYENLSE